MPANRKLGRIEVEDRMPLLDSVTAAAAPKPFGRYSHAAVTPDGTIWVSAQLPVRSGVSSVPALEQFLGSSAGLSPAAMRTASTTSSARWWPAIDQPTTSRVARPVAVATRHHMRAWRSMSSLNSVSA
jgi:hypothetical protein